MKKIELKKNDIVIETRAWVEDIAKIKDNLEKIGSDFVGKIKVVDEIYADLNDYSIEEHTYEKTKKAARIRTLFSNDLEKPTRCIANIREAITSEEIQDLGLHDITINTLAKESDPEQKSSLVEILQNKGFETLVKEIRKERLVYSYADKYIFLDDIENYAKAIEIRTKIQDKTQGKKTKDEHIEILKKLGVSEDDFISKSYTHLILDSHLKQNPELRVPPLRKLLKELEKKKIELLLNSEEHFREGGDGWHDNASWDALMEQVRVTEAQIDRVKAELMEK